MKHLKRAPQILVVVVALVLAMNSMTVALTTQSASATTVTTAPNNVTGYIYHINMVEVCQEKGHLGASLWNITPYGWYCYDFAFPAGLAYAGGADIQAWCNHHYPGSQAIIYENNAYGWRCNRNW